MTSKYFSTELHSVHEPRFNIHLDCDQNDIVALVGPSGSGKTTVLRSLAGLHRQAEGSIFVNGQYWLSTDNNIYLSPQQRSVGLLFQDNSLFPHKTAIENIMLAIHPANHIDNRKLAAQYLARVHLSGLEDRYPSQLSGGQKQRVALARALAREPDIILLDEPFSSVDHLTKKKLIRELNSLITQLEVPVILVTHDLDEARYLANKISVIHHGNTLQHGLINDVFSQPNNRQVAKLLGISNLFQATVEEHLPDKALTIINWEGKRFESRYKPEFQPAEKIDWLIPLENIVFHRKERPSNGEKENPLQGIIQDILVIGEVCFINVIVDNKHSFAINVSQHVAKRNSLAIGQPISFSLLTDAIHIMKQEM